MPPRFEFEFSDIRQPIISLRATSLQTSTSRIISALIDTGADITHLDSFVAERLGIPLQTTRTVLVEGVGGRQVEATLAEIELHLLDEDDLSLQLPVAFAPIQATTVGNLLGLDVLSNFDFALSHSQRLGYLGRATR